MLSLPICDCCIPELSSPVSCCDVPSLILFCLFLFFGILTGDSSKVGVGLGCSHCQCVTVGYLNSLH